MSEITPFTVPAHSATAADPLLPPAGQPLALAVNVSSIKNTPAPPAALQKYKARVDDFYTERKHPELVIARLDEQHLPQFIATENTRNEHLKLSWLPSAKSLVNEIKAGLPFDLQRFMIKISDTPHFVTFEVKKNSDGKISVIALDPACISEQHYELKEIIALINTLPGVSCIALVVDAQQYTVDAVIFALHYALKMAKNVAEFDHIHQLNLAGKISGLTDGYLEDDAVDRLLPPDFMKHAHFRSSIRRYLENHPGAATYRDGNQKTLMERYVENKIIIRSDGTEATKYAAPEDSEVYSRSIQHKRQKLIDRAIQQQNGSRSEKDD